MGLFSKKDEQQTREQGYVSFDPEEVKERANNENTNSEAYGYLDDAMFTSSHIKVRDKERGVVDVDDIYPITREEAEEMDRHLDKAQAALKDPSDGFFHERYNELRDIVAWSLQRHWTFSWKMIAAVVVSLFVFKACSESDQAEANKHKASIESIEAWEETDTTIAIESITPEMAAQMYHYSNYGNYASAKVFKMYQLGEQASFYHNSQKYVEEYTAKIDTCKSEELIEAFKKNIQDNRGHMEEALAKYNEINEAAFEDIQKMAIEEVESNLDEAQGSANKMMFWYIFFIVMIPLYIIAERPYGYTITRYRTEAKVLTGIRRYTKILSAGLFAAGAGLHFTDIVTKWSDGSTTREDNGLGPAILVLKIALFVGAVAVLCLISCVLLTYSTFTGLYRNYPWSEWFTSAKGKYEERKANNQK